MRLVPFATNEYDAEVRPRALYGYAQLQARRPDGISRTRPVLLRVSDSLPDQLARLEAKATSFMARQPLGSTVAVSFLDGTYYDADTHRRVGFAEVLRSPGFASLCHALTAPAAPATV